MTLRDIIDLIADPSYDTVEVYDSSQTLYEGTANDCPNELMGHKVASIYAGIVADDYGIRIVLTED